MAPIPPGIHNIMSLAPRSVNFPLQGIKEWNPFRIDALGLVTLLGAEEVNRNVGTLQRRRFTEFLPLLAAFIIAGNRFADEQPGYCVYNVSDGIHTTELKGWFTRWLSAQSIRRSTTIFTWAVDGPPIKHAAGKQLIAPLLAAVAVAPLVVCTILIGDWYGLGNAIAVILSVVVRKVLLWQRRNAVNAVASQKPGIPAGLPGQQRRQSEKPLNPTDSITTQLHRAGSQPLLDDLVTMFVTRADGRMVTMYTPCSLLLTFVRDSPVARPYLYHLMQWLGWAAFGAHIVVLGMSTLFTQIYTVILLVLSTWALCHDFPWDSGRVRSTRQAPDGTTSEIITTAFTSRLSVVQEDPVIGGPEAPVRNQRTYAYIRAEPTAKQEQMLKHWSMLPFEGVPWYDSYEAAKERYAKDKQRAAAASSRPLGSGKAPPTPSPMSVSSVSVQPGARPEENEQA